MDVSRTEKTGAVPFVTPSMAVTSALSIMVVCTAEEECGSTGSHKVSGHLCVCTTSKHASHMVGVVAAGGPVGLASGPTVSLEPSPAPPWSTHIPLVPLSYPLVGSRVSVRGTPAVGTGTVMVSIACYESVE